MITFKYLLYTICLANAILGLEICTIDVRDCLTKGARNIYKALVNGVNDLVEPIDPLLIPTLDAELPSFKYHLTNATMSGLKNCTVDLFDIGKLSLSFEFNIRCPKVIFTYNFDAKGEVVPNVEFDGKGFATVNFDDYIIKIKGNLREFVSLKHLGVHLSVVDHFIETELNGKLTFETDDLVHPDKAKSDLAKTFINENSKLIEKKFLFSPFMENFIKMFVKRLDTYLANFSLKDIFKNEETKNILNKTGLRLL